MTTLNPAIPGRAAAAPPADDLEALFDQVSAETHGKPAETPTYSAADEDLEALFDRVSEASQGAAAPAAEATAAGPGTDEPVDVFHRIGTLTRNLHEALRQLGYDKAVENAVGSLPDARARLSYIARLTGEAAEKVLAAVEQGQGVQAKAEADAKAFSARWDRVFANESNAEEFRALATETRAYFAQVPQRTGETQALFTEIMMAQDFHDLTGQVIQKVVGVAQTLEAQLLKLLLETTPPEVRSGEGFLNGPVIDATRGDAVTNQTQVDDLLESLGF